MKKFNMVLATIVMIGALTAPTAFAHQGNPDFRSEITSIDPSSLGEGLDFSIQNFDDNVELVNRSGKEVMVEGYDGEPYIRINSSGVVEVNLNSPAYYLNEDRLAEVELPDRADANAAPDWKEVDSTGQFSWHDHRSHYMGLGTPSQVEDKSKTTKIFDYLIPIRVDGKRAEVHGTLTWVGQDSGFPLVPFLVLAIVAIGLGGFLFLRRQNESAEINDSTSDTNDSPDQDENEAW